jgi:hypothetical protein
MEVELTLEQEIQKGQLEDPKIQEIKEMIEAGKAPNFTEDEHGTVWFQKRICVPDVDHLREKILQEAHDSAYSIHPGSTKMYQDLNERYWWYGMKRDVEAHVALCDVCQKVKAEHQKPAGLLQPLKVPEWKWEENGTLQETIYSMMKFNKIFVMFLEIVTDLQVWVQSAKHRDSLSISS